MRYVVILISMVAVGISLGLCKDKSTTYQFGDSIDYEALERSMHQHNSLVVASEQKKQPNNIELAFHQNYAGSSYYDRIASYVYDHSPHPTEWLELIRRESSYNPHAVNASSGACGLPQALPCSKMACELDDVECQLRWMNSYIERRYGSARQALAFHNINNWY